MQSLRDCDNGLCAERRDALEFGIILNGTEYRFCSWSCLDDFIRRLPTPDTEYIDG